MSANSKTWKPTGYPNLYRHKSDIYYARLGKRTWRSLRTKLKSVAIKKLAEELALEEKRENLPATQETIPLRTVGDAFLARQKQIANDVGKKASTKKFYEDIFNVIPNVWKGIHKRTLRSLSAEECEEWAGNFDPDISASHFNHILSVLRSSLEIAVKKGILTANPFAGVRQRKTVGKDLTGALPTREEFAALINEIRKSPSRWGDACADLVEFLAYSGLRIGEAEWVLWKHCDLIKGELTVVGEPVEGTKNRQIRRVPIIPDLDKLIRQILDRRLDATMESKVLGVKSASNAIKRASKIVGISPLTHHDFRHFFATVCIESGVDIPTLSRWLGHTDGGVLAMKTYGHLRNEHSLAAAKKVKF